MLLASSCKKEENNPDAIKDGDGNVYTSITVGTQIWLVENLKTTKYNDGGSIPLVIDDPAWENLATPGYCWYENNETSNKSTYGALYNWYAVTTGKLCPTGWHVPTDDEWTTLITQLGGEAEASGKLREAGTAHWNSPNTDADNSSKFTALPGGFRQLSGNYVNKGEFGVWWSATEDNLSSDSAWERYLVYDYNNAYRGSDLKNLGFSVRCIKN
ncbi:MAG: fibrobacter succinogenes major paralogous domain-containing protein [Bacteroidales bacterium]|nr:fibrobacter succinogenes major paralogous domain-containing protein [Bacteroidales bacterium]